MFRPSKFEFVINRQTARPLRVQILPTLLAIADGAIETRHFISRGLMPMAGNALREEYEDGYE